MRKKTNGLTITWLRNLIQRRTKQINDVIDAGLYDVYKDNIGNWFDEITEAEITILKIRRARIFKGLKIKIKN